MDTNGDLIVKNLATTAEHTFIIGKHITEISGQKTIEGLVNRVYFWNEKGTVDPDYIKLTYDDTDSQTSHDIIAEYITDSKITNTSAANLLAGSRVYDKKDPKVKITVTLNNSYDLSSIEPGQTCQILNLKNNPYKVGTDTVLVIKTVKYEVDSATLEISEATDDFEDMVEEERQRLDKELTWFGYITQQLTAAQLGPADRTWTSDIIFSATTGADAYRQVDWTAGIVYLPTSSGAAAGKRVIVAGNTGLLSAATDYYIYLDEETFNTSAATVVSGTGTIKQGGDALLDASKAWTNDQYKGYIVTIGGQTKIIKSNTATVLTIEDRWTIADSVAAYTIKKMSFDVTSDKTAVSNVTKVIFSNVKANPITTSEAVIVPESGQSINIDGSTQIAQRSISANRIIANSITANEINTASIGIGVWSGTLDDVDDGSTYVKPTINQRNGGGYAYSGLDSSGNVKIPVDSTKMSSGSAPSTGIFIDSTGIYGRYGGDTVFSILTASASAYFKGTIEASTITGGTLQTSASGKRVVIAGADNEVTFYDSSGEVGSIYGVSGFGYNGMSLFSTGATPSNIHLTNARIYIADGLQEMLFVHNGSYSIFASTDNADIELGGTSNRWKEFWSVLGNFSGTITSSSVIPSADSTYDLGSSSYYYLNAYLDNITTTGSVYVNWLRTTGSNPDIGASGAQFRNIFVQNVGSAGAKATVYCNGLSACPLPISEDALIKLEKSIFKKLPKGKGHFGDEIKYLDIPDAPDETKKNFKDDKNNENEDIDIIKTVGFLYSCVMELNEKIKLLKVN
jgi:hypothetical protein